MYSLTCNTIRCNHNSRLRAVKGRKKFISTALSTEGDGSTNRSSSNTWTVVYSHKGLNSRSILFMITGVAWIQMDQRKVISMTKM